MALDTGINDPSNCYFMNDSSIPPHSGTGQWWLSPDVIMSGADPSTATPGVGGAVTSLVTVRNNNCTLDPGDTVRFDLFVCTPSLNIAPFPPDAFVATTDAVVAAFGSPTSVPWTVTGSSSDPAGPGHKCLIARCYPFLGPGGKGSTPDPANLSPYLPQDPHYAQHNLTVVAVSSGGMHKIPIKTGNQRLQSQLVLVHAVADIQPSRTTLAAITPSLRATSGFKQIATQPLRNVSINLESLAVKPGGGLFHQIQASIHPMLASSLATVENRFVTAHPTGVLQKVQIGPKAFTTFDLTVDLSGAKAGDAHIYHLTQTTAQGQPDGGLTVVVVAQ